MGGNAVLPFVIPETQRAVGLCRIQPFFLESVRTDLVGKPDPATLLPEIEQDPAPHFADRPESRHQLVVAITPEGPQDVPRQALRMDADGHSFLVEDLSMDQGRVFLIIFVVAKSDHLKIPIERGEVGYGEDLHADPVLADPFTLMILIFFEELLDLLPRQCRTNPLHIFHVILPSARNGL
jgi:hypothetical protein